MLIESSFSVKKITAGGLVLNNNNEVLLIQKKKLWDLPKGKLDRLESLEKAAVREVVEETGIDQSYLKLVRPLITTDYYSKKKGKKIPKKANWFLMHYDGVDLSLFPDPNESIDDARRVSFDELPHFLSNSRAYVRAVISAIHLNKCQIRS